MRAFSRRLAVGMTGFALASAGATLVLTSTPASAVISGNVLSGTTSPLWQTNGTVHAVLVSGNTIYAGGEFTRVRPPGTTTSSPQAVTRNHLAAFNATTGALITGFNPNVNGNVKSLAISPDGTRLYAGGQFTNVSGTARNRLAAVNPTTGALVTGFNPNVNSTVNGLAATSTNVYLGGPFTARRRAEQVLARGGQRHHRGAQRHVHPAADAAS